MKKAKTTITKTILIMLIITTIITGIAKAETIHEGWHSYHDYFTIGEDYYEVSSSQLWNGEEGIFKVLIQKNQEKYILSAPINREEYYLNDTDCTKQGYYRYCLLNTSLQEKDGARIDEEGNYRLGFKIGIYYEKPDEPTASLTIDKNTDKTTINYDETTKTTITITNEGDNHAYNVIINETIGEGLKILSFEGFDYLIGNNLIKTIPKMMVGEGTVLKYQATPTSFFNSTKTTTTIKYYDGLENQTTKKETTITLPWPYKETTTLSPTNIKPGKESTITITVTNNDAKPITLDITQEIPPNIIIKKTDLTKTEDNELITIKTIPPGETTTINTKITSYYTGSYDINNTIKITVRNKEHLIREGKTITVSNDKITPILTIPKSKYQSGERMYLGAYLKNNDQTISYYDIKGTVKASFINEEISLENIRPGEQKTLFLKEFKLPTVTEEQTEDITINGTYKTIAGEIFSFETKKTITIIPKNKTLLFYHSATPNTAQPGEEITVSATVQNLAQTNQEGITVKDEIPEGLTTTFGKTKAEGTIKGGEKIRIMLYKIKIPEDWDKEEIIINSTLTQNNKKIAEIIEPIKIINITKKEETETKETTEQQETQETTNNNEQKQEEKKEKKAGGNFIINFFKAIGDFLNNLLS